MTKKDDEKSDDESARYNTSEIVGAVALGVAVGVCAVATLLLEGPFARRGPPLTVAPPPSPVADDDPDVTQDVPLVGSRDRDPYLN